jgi:hypothetical protein
MLWIAARADALDVNDRASACRLRETFERARGR